MKKLMIAAAAAALIGGANADLVYDFSASMKTTTAKSSSQSATYSYYFGFAKNSAGEYWYTNTAVLNWDASGIYADWTDGTEVIAAKLIKRDSKTGKGTIQSGVWNKLSQEQKLKFVDDFKAFGNYFYDDQPAEKSVTDPSYQDPGFEGVKEVYRGKPQWCLTIKWSNKVTSTSCYRVAGSVKLVGKYIVGNCCDPDTTWTADWSGKNAQPGYIYDAGTETYYYNLDLTPIFSYRFGALTLEKANKAEFVACIGHDEQTKLPQLCLAGQGSIATLKDQYGEKSEGISSISGNIVGVWLDPMCETCCGNNGDAVVFDCDYSDALWSGSASPDASEPDGGYASKNINALGSQVQADNVAEPIWARGFKDTDDGDLWGTAAYGTFTLKFNSKESEF